MLNRIRSARANAGDEGFTLIEMLIVIVVLGILAGIAVFGVATFRDDAVAASCDATKKTVETASDAYIAKTGLNTATVQTLVNLKYLKTKTVPTSVTLAAGVVGGDCTATTKYEIVAP